MALSVGIPGLKGKDKVHQQKQAKDAMGGMENTL